MEKTYWIGRKRASMGMARGAASAEARLIHYDLAGRYSIKAAECVAAARPAAEAERAMLHLPSPAWLGPVPAASGPEEGLEARTDPDMDREQGR
ncbi:MAG: hypothetical protein QOE79_2810 [Sphingomonadales bacterium]|jgi:hypothetical protein|nr:hypothetical protein [Sphingomonadales bacterium]MEA3048416.1 hypothetical protein [Sphingomonadales bacterium]